MTELIFWVVAFILIFSGATGMLASKDRLIPVKVRKVGGVISMTLGLWALFTILVSIS